MSFETIRYEKTDKIIRLTLNRPDKRNSLTPQMLDELRQGFEQADLDDEACAIILTGAGDKAFCAGADLGGFAQADGFLAKYESQALFPRLFAAMERSRKPTIAAINGACVAGGFGLMMACDLAIAKESAKLGTPEIQRGLFPYMISYFILRDVPRRKAFELMMLGDTFSAREAESWNVINKAVPDAEYPAAVEAWATKLAGYSPAVLRLGRRALVSQQGMSMDGALQYLQGLLTVNTTMEDALEGISAFFEKRPAQWKGR